MFRLFAKPKNPHLDALREEIRRFAAIVERASPIERFAIANSVGMATEILSKRFGGMEGFRAAAAADRDKFFDSLVTMATQLMEKKEMHSAAGFRLFTVWLCGVLEDNRLRDDAAVVLDMLKK